MIKKWFITGTDTNVGKTISSMFLLKQAKKNGYIVSACKPISCGSQNKNGKLENFDLITLKKYSSIPLSTSDMNSYLFHDYSSPHILSMQQNNNIQLSTLSQLIENLSKKSNWILVEGAGGWHTPLSTKILYSDWVKKENFSIILIVGMKLGCINHAILTRNAILNSGLLLSGWIANCITPENKYSKLYLSSLKEYLNVPFLGKIPNFNNKEEIFNSNINLKIPQ
ncbi:ATP-dependent dethiobiotin synthetase BioD [Buchnera aphidicola (Eriosoma lanigerum)]|uniref:dethiobiotin synthase n=1 Tax=Buchnera aphidicola TaxID=9 RepID=UPI003464477D